MAMEGVELVNGLENKISCNSYKVILPLLISGLIFYLSFVPYFGLWSLRHMRITSKSLMQVIFTLAFLFFSTYDPRIVFRFRMCWTPKISSFVGGRTHHTADLRIIIRQEYNGSIDFYRLHNKSKPAFSQKPARKGKHEIAIFKLLFSPSISRDGLIWIILFV